MAEQEKLTPPYIAYATFKNTVVNLGKGGIVHDRIDGSLLGSMGGSAKLQFLGALRFLDLTGDDKRPSATMSKLMTASEAEWPKLMADVVKTHYAGQIKSLATGTPAQLKESFGDDYPSIVVPAVRFLVAAATDAGLQVADHHKVQRGRSPGSSNRKKRKSGDQGDANVLTPPEETLPENMMRFPIPIPGGLDGAIIIPRNLTDDHVLLVKAAVTFLEAYAKQSKANKTGKE